MLGMESSKSTSDYLIEESVVFNPRSGTVRSIADAKEITLLAASSECFLMMIRKHGVLVTKGELMHEGWEKYGLPVTDHTFYQNISLLRRRLKECGVNNPVIKTVPRKGLYIPLSIKVNPFNQAYALDTHRQIKSIIKDEGDKPEHCGNNHLESTVTQHGKFSGYKNEHLSSHRVLSLRYKPRKTALFILSVLLLIFGFLINLPSNYFLQYKRIDSINGCNLFAMPSHGSVSNYKLFFEKNNIHCHENDNVYLSMFRYIPSVSVIKCSNTNARTRNHFLENCTSIYYLDNYNDQ